MPIRGVAPGSLRRRLTAMSAAGSVVVVAALGFLFTAHGHRAGVAGPAGAARASSAVVTEESHAAVSEAWYAAAAAEAHRLVPLVQPPAGSRLLLPELVNNVRGSDTYLVGRGDTWTVALSSAQATEWLTSYDPPGFARHGVVLLNAPGTIASDMGLSRPPGSPWYGRLSWAERAFSDARPSRIWSAARLSISLVPVQAPREILLEIHAVITLRGQDLSRDIVAGSRLRVASAGPCPESVEGAVGVVNPGRPELDRMLVPEGTPSGGRICFYGGYTAEDQLRLQSERVLDRAAAARLAGIARMVQLGRSDYMGPYSGLGNGPGTAVVVLAYPSGPDVDLWSFNEGRGMVANGHVEADSSYADSGFSGFVADFRPPETPAPGPSRSSREVPE